MQLAFKSVKWVKLELVCLRCTSLRPYISQELVTRLLLAAGRAVESMPKLRIMEIWNTGPRYAYLFRYTLNHHNATITWRCAGKHWRLTSEAIGAWVIAASRRTHRQLSVEIHPFSEPQEVLRLNRRCIYRHLALRRLVCDPVTLEQVEAEASLGGNA